MAELEWTLVRVEDRSKTILLADPILGYTTVQFIGHAEDRMKDWGLTEDDALKALKEPDLTGLATEPGRERVRRNKTTRSAVDVVYEKRSDRLCIITVIKVSRRLVERKRKK